MCERGLGDEVVGDPVGELRERVRRERRDHVQVGTRQVRVEVLARLAPGEREVRLAADEALSALGDERHDVMAGLDEQPNELARLVRGDTSGHADEHACPRPHCADERADDAAGAGGGLARREAYAAAEQMGSHPRVYLAYVVLIMPSAISSMDMVK